MDTTGGWEGASDSSNMDASTTTAGSDGSPPERLDVGESGTDEDADPDGDGTCTDVVLQVDPQIPTVVLLVDQSVSMNEDLMGMTRWATLAQVLTDPVGGVLSRLDDRIRFGATLFTSVDGHAGGECPQITAVDPQLGGTMAIGELLSASAPVAETPTGESIDAVVAELVAFSEPGPKSILLATDGLPDTCTQPNPNEGLEVSERAAEAAFDAGVETYVLSVGPDVAQDHLQRMANLGVGRDADDPNAAPYWQALDAAALEQALLDIIGRSVSCTFDLGGTVQVDDWCVGKVLVDGVEIDCPSGWALIGDSTIELLGDACDRIKDGATHTVEASFPCGAATPTP